MRKYNKFVLTFLVLFLNSGCMVGGGYNVLHTQQPLYCSAFKNILFNQDVTEARAHVRLYCEYSSDGCPMLWLHLALMENNKDAIAQYSQEALKEESLFRFKCFSDERWEDE